FLLLIFVSRPLAGFALRFTNFEYFWLGVFGLSMSAVITTGSTNRGFISAFLGLLISTIGVDITTGFPRFVFGSAELMDGVEFIPAMIGLFGVSEVFRYVMNPGDFKRPSIVDKLKVSFSNISAILWKFKGTIARSSLIGTCIGALPGAGADIAAWVSYGLGKRLSKHPEKFGTGYEEGVLAPTSANNAALGGTWIPALVFGIPGDTITAIVLGAMLMYGLKPGPLIFTQSPELVNQIFAVGIISQIFMMGIGLLGIKGFSYVLKIPSNIVMPAVLGFSIVGSFALRNSSFDILVMLAFGILGFLMERTSIPLPPLILGLILGPMIEDNLRVGLLKTSGQIGSFFTRPICAILILIIVVVLFGEQVFKAGKYLFKKFNEKGQMKT
ncbi:MAG: tripartite tricarboxylate transporter permease, partial [Firmicutes bacterium]|nr:tripartite tricarboxylate transporter permease [Bacillota bacterium]